MEIKEAAMKYGLKIGQILEFAGWVLTNKFQPPERVEEPEEPAEKEPEHEIWDVENIKSWPQEKIDRYLERHWLSKDCYGNAAVMPTHSRWYHVKLYFLKDPNTNFQPAIRFIEANIPRDRDLINARWPALGKRPWSEAKEEIRRDLLDLLKHPEKRKINAVMHKVAKQYVKVGGRQPVKIIQKTIKIAVPAKRSLKESKA
jgi:hypothetical protein